jgi:hypothetical protein
LGEITVALPSPIQQTLISYHSGNFELGETYLSDDHYGRDEHRYPIDILAKDFKVLTICSVLCIELDGCFSWSRGGQIIANRQKHSQDSISQDH